MNKNNRQKIEAVYDDELIQVLKDLNLLSDIEKEKVTCFYCDKTITLNNLQYIFTNNGQIVISCNDRECCNKFAEKHDI